MGSPLHRLTIVLVAGIVLLAAVLAIVVIFIAPQARPYVAASPQPVAISVLTPTADIMPTTGQAPTPTSTATVEPTHTPTTIVTPTATSSAPPTQAGYPPRSTTSTARPLRGSSPLMVLIIGVIGIGIVGIMACIAWSRRRPRGGVVFTSDPHRHQLSGQILEQPPATAGSSDMGNDTRHVLESGEAQELQSSVSPSPISSLPAAVPNASLSDSRSAAPCPASLVIERHEAPALVAPMQADAVIEDLPVVVNFPQQDVSGTSPNAPASTDIGSGATGVSGEDAGELLHVADARGEPLPDHVGVVDPAGIIGQECANSLLALLDAADGQDHGLATFLPEQEVVSVFQDGPKVPEWTTDDRAMIVCSAVLRTLATRNLRSPVLAIDVTETTVHVILDIQPAEVAELRQICADLAMMCRDWRCSWQSFGLTIVLPLGGSIPRRPWPIVIPVLFRRRGKSQITRYIPLASWRHLGVYGYGALGVAHHIVTTVLCQQPPDALALTIIDGSLRHPITSIYRSAPHLIPAPSDPNTWVEQIVRAVRQTHSTPFRAVLCVVVEPQDAWLSALNDLFLRLRSQPVPVHILLVSSTLSSRGREVYAALPALMTEGVGPVHWIHGTQQWPARGQIRMVTSRTTRCDGEPFSVNDNEAAALVQQMPALEVEHMPVIWEMVSASPGVATAIAGGSPDVIAHDSTSIPPSVEESGATADEPLLLADANGMPAVESPVVSLLADVLDEGSASAEAAFPLMLDRHDPVTAARLVLESPVTPFAPPAAPEVSPTIGPETEAELLPAESPQPLSPAAQRLGAIVSGSAPSAVAMSQVAVVPDVPADDAEFPPMPGKLRGSDLRNILTRAICNETIVASTFPGLSPKRLKQCMDRALHPYADTMLVWFEQAGLLAEPAKAEEPFRHPRRLMSEDLRWMAERLRATPVPHEDEVDVAMNRGGGAGA